MTVNPSIELVTSDAHARLVAAIATTLAGAAWQRCRTHYAANLMSITPKPSWGWVKALLHSIYDPPHPRPNTPAQHRRRGQHPRRHRRRIIDGTQPNAYARITSNSSPAAEN